MSAMWRLPKIMEVTGGSPATIDRWEKSGDFPRRKKLSPHGRAVAWDSDEVEAWIKTRQTVQPDRDATKIGKGLPGPGRPKKAAPAQQSA